LQTLVFFSAAAAGARDLPKSVTIGYFGAVNAQLVAKGLGLDRKEMGVPVKWVKFDSGRDIITALASKSIDIGEIGTLPAATAISNGLPIEGVFISHLSGRGVGLFVSPKLGISGPRDLIGKKVAVPFGTNPHYLLITALRLNGVDPRQVKIIDMSPAEMAAAYMRGDIDGGWVWQPNLGKVVSAGAKIILTSEDMARKGYPTGDMEVVRKDFAKKYPDLVTKFVQGECLAAHVWLTQPHRANVIVSKELSIPPALARQLMEANRVLTAKEQLVYLGSPVKKGRLSGDLKAVADFLFKEKRIKAVPDGTAFDRFVNPGYLEKAVKNTGGCKTI
ncbi:MAG: ABC transporter substrate-binding protein, partial [Gammaproteobacteria bacterium]|nr:ABC transporter substrate-binding protein [Gammaproteobacteria bacterium]